MFQGIHYNPRFQAAMVAFVQEFTARITSEFPGCPTPEEDAALEWLVTVIDGHVVEQVTLALRAYECLKP